MSYPACLGWLDRELPGWFRQELAASLKLVCEVLLSHWDIHPVMVSHTWMIDVKTGRPVSDVSPTAMENWYPGAPKSADELAEYIAYAPRIPKNCGFACEGVTSPGGFGNGAKRGFEHCKRVILASHARFGDRTIWLKASELARYWAARALTRIEHKKGHVTCMAPLACPGFTLRVSSAATVQPQLRRNDVPLPLTEVRTRAALKPATWLQEAGVVIVCFELPRGSITLDLGAGSMP